MFKGAAAWSLGFCHGVHLFPFIFAFWKLKSVLSDTKPNILPCFCLNNNTGTHRLPYTVMFEEESSGLEDSEEDEEELSSLEQQQETTSPLLQVKEKAEGIKLKAMLHQ